MNNKIIKKCRKGEPLTFFPIIDCHCHFGNSFDTKVPYNLSIPEVITEMDAYGIDIVWFSASDPGYAGDLSKANDKILELMGEIPDRVMLLCTLSAHTPNRNLEELKRCYRRGTCVGVKMHIYNQPSYKLTDSWLQPVFEFLNERNLVYLNHRLGDLETVRTVLDRYPNVTFIEGHPNQEILEETKNWSNLYCNSCASLKYRSTEKNLKKYGSDNYLLGSDFNLFQAGFGIGPIAYARIAEAEKRKVLGQNAWDLMKEMEWYQKGCPGRLKQYE